MKNIIDFEEMKKQIKQIGVAESNSLEESILAEERKKKGLKRKITAIESRLAKMKIELKKLYMHMSISKDQIVNEKSTKMQLSKLISRLKREL